MADIVTARGVMVSVKQFIVTGAETAAASLAELSGLLAAMFLVSLQLLSVPEASYVADLPFLAAL